MSPTRKVAKKAAKKVTRKAGGKKAAKKVARAASGKKPAAKKAAAKKPAPPKKAAAKKPAPAKKAAAKKPAAKKAAAKKVAVKKAAVKKVAREASRAQKVAARKTVAKKAPAKPVAAAKPAAVAKPAPVAKPKSAAKPAPKKYEQKTKPTGESVDAHIGAIKDPGRRQDCRTLVEVFSKATGKQPKMWGPSIVAFGKYHYKYESGHEGDSCLAGFASRKGAITLYLSCDPVERGEFMRRIGKHREGVGCVYIKDLEGVDLQVLGEMVKASADYIRLKHPNEVED